MLLKPPNSFLGRLLILSKDYPNFCPVFTQPAENAAKPLSVIGCSKDCQSTFGKAMITSEPKAICLEQVSNLSRRSCQNLRIKTVVVMDPANILNQLHSLRSNIVQPSDKRTDEGGAGLCCEQGSPKLKQRVTLTEIPSSLMTLVALMPFTVKEIFTFRLSPISRRQRPSRTIPSASVGTFPRNGLVHQLTNFSKHFTD